MTLSPKIQEAFQKLKERCGAKFSALAEQRAAKSTASTKPPTGDMSFSEVEDAEDACDRRVSQSAKRGKKKSKK